MRKYYFFRELDDSGKSTFLQIVVNTILIFLTFWLGISMQLIISNSQDETTGILTNVSYIEKMIPYKYDIDRLLDFHGLSTDLLAITVDEQESTKNSVAYNALEHYCKDSLLFASCIQNVDSLLTKFADLKCVISSKYQNDYNEKLKDVYLLYIKTLIYTGTDFTNELSSLRYRQILSDNHYSQLLSFAIIYTNNLMTHYDYFEVDSTKSITISCKILILRKLFINLYELNNFLSDSLYARNNTNFWNNRHMLPSLLLLLIVIFLCCVYAIAMKIAINDMNIKVPSNRYNKMKNENRELSQQLKKNMLKLTILNRKYQDIQNQNQ